MTEFETIIGLEVHAQLKTASKIFCRCKANFGAEPNTNVCPVCMGHPGILPKLNEKVVEFALKTALALGCKINLNSSFARKNYFYPDLPKGYQITQYEVPLAENGKLKFVLDGITHEVGIIRVHIEEDAGKNIHASGDYSLVDFNRCGIPLIEIVGAPDLRSTDEAVEYLKTLRQTLRYLGICDGNMEEGSLRCDANLSLRPAGQTQFGTKVELKNMNSFKYIQMALEYEIERQKKIIIDGGVIKKETRMYIDNEKRTATMRDKEEADDYRYFPEPDLPPLILSNKYVEENKETLPILPLERKQLLQDKYGLPEYDTGVLTAEKSIADYFEEVALSVSDYKKASNFIMTELLREIKVNGLDVDFPVPAQHLRQLLSMVEQGKITGKIAKDVFEKMIKSKEHPIVIITREGLITEGDENKLRDLCTKIVEKNPDEVRRYKEGKKNLFGFFVGEIMKETKGKADPKIVNTILNELLNK